MRCEATTKAGKSCQAQAKRGGSLCSAHLGTAHRPTKLADVEDAIILSVRTGNSYAGAAGAAGISRTTLASWRERGEAGVEPFAAFLVRLTRAREEGKARLVALLSQAAATDWRAALAMLERMYPDEWGRRERHEHTGRGGGPIEVNADALKQPDVREAGRELIERVAAARAVQPGRAGAGD